VVLAGLGAGDTTLWCGALGKCIADGGTTYDALEREVTWSSMLHRGGEVPRRVALQGTREPDGVEPLYRHPVDGSPLLVGWTPLVDGIRHAVEAHVGHPLNHCLLQLYRHGRDWIGEHSDKTLDVARPSAIVNVSLGRMRTMVLRPKRAREAVPAAAQKIPLPHGSFLVMGLATNSEFYHEIRQEGASADDGPRISLTFRHIGTLYDAGSGAVWGVGAPTDDRAEAEARARALAALPADERERQERAEAEHMRSAEFLALNPRGQTPVLVEPDGTRVNESLAILTYLELRYPEPALLPRAEPGALARVLALVQEAETFACAYEPLEMLFIDEALLARRRRAPGARWGPGRPWRSTCRCGSRARRALPSSLASRSPWRTARSTRCWHTCCAAASH